MLDKDEINTGDSLCLFVVVASFLLLQLSYFPIHFQLLKNKFHSLKSLIQAYENLKQADIHLLVDQFHWIILIVIDFELDSQ